MITIDKPTPYRDSRIKIKQVAIEVAVLPFHDLSYFFREMFLRLPQNKKHEVIEIVAGYQFEDGGRWLKIEKWMTSCFTNHHHYTPSKVAGMCLKYWKMHYTMKPLLLKRARKIKDRVRKRIVNSANTDVDS